ncbi:MAG: hypothetical protein OEZ01_15485, partial [Candidatus Heimdallarchaeota archaeon]|nr:hypothetical protein [Candidatus Heimdallarchaeota archaeon]
KNASSHQHLLKNIPLYDRFDRPDILHFGLLTILGYVNFIPNMSIYFSIKDTIYEVSSNIRLPRDQTRFYGILEGILSNKYKENLIKPVSFSIGDFSTPSIAFSKNGRKISKSDYKSKTFIFGGFPRGNFKTSLPNECELVSLSNNSLDLWTSLSYFLSNYIIEN